MVYIRIMDKRILDCENPICANLLSVREQQIESDGKISHLTELYDTLECRLSCLQKEVGDLRIVEAKLGFIASEIDSLKGCWRGTGEAVERMSAEQKKFIDSHSGDVGYILTFIVVGATVVVGFLTWLITMVLPGLAK